MTTLRAALPAEDGLIARHNLALWESEGVPSTAILAEAKDATLMFLNEGRAAGQIVAFVAESEGRITGSIACYVEIKPYPDAMALAKPKFGYIWLLFVEPEFRGRGIGRKLICCALTHLTKIGCSMAVLHPSKSGESLYLKSGFKFSNEMRIDLPIPVEASDRRSE